jgi:hypothetical protein
VATVAAAAVAAAVFYVFAPCIVIKS